MTHTKYVPDGKNYFLFGKEQIQLFLGDSDRSFLVGFGNNPPQFPHHAGSSCPQYPYHVGSSCPKSISETYDWDAYLSSEPNPNILYGALVGGPSSLAGL